MCVCVCVGMMGIRIDLNLLLLKTKQKNYVEGPLDHLVAIKKLFIFFIFILGPTLFFVDVDEEDQINEQQQQQHD